MGRGKEVEGYGSVFWKGAAEAECLVKWIEAKAECGDEAGEGLG